MASSMVLQSAEPEPPAGFEQAIGALLPRTVKLYGLKVGREAGYGTGVLVSQDGLVLTVYSLLIDARKVRAVTDDGTRYLAEVVDRDPQRQLALLRLKPFDGDHEGGDANVSRETRVGPFPYFDLDTGHAAGSAKGGGETSRPLQLGDWVVAAGNAFKVAEGAEPMSIVHGILSAKTRLDARRSVKEFPYHGEVLVIDAVTSNPGEPGSAVVNLDGEFVGLVGRLVISNLTHTHFNYAVPRDVLAGFLIEATAPNHGNESTVAAPEGERPVEGGGGERAAEGAEDRARKSRTTQRIPVDLGIRVVRAGYQNLPPIVDHVRRGSPAEIAGVRKDDLVLSINGLSVKDVREYDERLEALSAGETIDLLIRRDRQVIRLKLKPETTP